MPISFGMKLVRLFTDQQIVKYDMAICSMQPYIHLNRNAGEPCLEKLPVFDAPPLSVNDTPLKEESRF